MEGAGPSHTKANSNQTDRKQTNHYLILSVGPGAEDPPADTELSIPTCSAGHGAWGRVCMPTLYSDSTVLPPFIFLSGAGQWVQARSCSW